MSDNLISMAKLAMGKPDYRKVAGSRLSWLVAHYSIFTLFMKGKFRKKSD